MLKPYPLDKVYTFRPASIQHEKIVHTACSPHPNVVSYTVMTYYDIRTLKRLKHSAFCYTRPELPLHITFQRKITFSPIYNLL